MVVEGFSRFGARHTEVGALANLLAFTGATAPHSGQPYSEPFLFGAGGGVGFAYFLFERRGSHAIYLGTRVHTRETERPEFFQTIAERIGFQTQVHNSSSASASVTNVKKALSEGKPLLVWTDGAKLPYTGLVGFGNFYHVLVVYGIDDAAELVHVADRAPGPEIATLQELRAARETSWSPKYRAMTIAAPENPTDPRVAAEQGIRHCIQQMNEGLGIANFGLRGLHKWAGILTSTKEKKSWLKIFPPGAGLYCALSSLFEQIATRGDGGGACRALFADFLEEAADLLERPALRDVAAMYRDAGRLWIELAEAHLPDAVPAFAEARQLLCERKRLFETQGSCARERLDTIRERLGEIERACSAEFPMPASEIRPLFADLRQKILRVREQEGKAVEALAAAIA